MAATSKRKSSQAKVSAYRRRLRAQGLAKSALEQLIAEGDFKCNHRRLRA